MRSFKTLSEICPPIELITPGTTGAADRSSDFISMKNAPNGVAIIVQLNQAAANTVTIAPWQSTNVSGASPADEKVLANVVPIYSNLDCAAGDTLTKRTQAINYTTDAGVKHKIVIFEILPEHLDVSNNFDCVKIIVSSSSASNIMGAIALPLGRRYANESMIAD